ncbi:class I SAM-dependent methyltransferase [Thiothrix winogradskyi]|uniref:Class I SAM-dependent methyltransferase n=1 Tax=Thiothrix winogradskyi TaxID=96472 RepID=A0ABY3SYY3_9GAMM|nr:class I SAM-dependent methyltransferase [Thiothrix winogradskyi]UJS24333.1 class I SAM-dependent methyltransferase [Thiothrix winogradskyi]
MQKSGGIRAGFQGLEGMVVPVKIKALASLRSSDYRWIAGIADCELGCGQGITSLIMAANYPQGHFYAIDFNPSHIAKARRLAEAAGLTNITFYEKSFAQIAENPNLLPECDFIALHGIFTWVSDENRQHIIDICERHLKSGGMVYNSYNAKPGWVMGEPLQKLVYEASKLYSGNSIARMEQAVGLLKKLHEADSRFFAINRDMIKTRLETLESKDKHYLVHEYFHEGWRAFYFTEVAGYMSAAKLDFIGDATASSAYVPSLISADAQNLLTQIPDTNVRELFKDMLFNTGFRKDIFMRGIAGRMSSEDQAAYLHNTVWALRKRMSEQEKAEFTFDLPIIGRVQGKADVYRPLVELLEQQSMTFSELRVKSGMSITDLLQCLIFMLQEDLLALRHGKQGVASVAALNKALASQTFNTKRSSYIALPAVCGSIALSVLDMLFFQVALETGNADDSDHIIQQVAHALESRGLHVNYNGQQLTGEAMMKRLRELESVWCTSALPVLRDGGALL